MSPFCYCTGTVVYGYGMVWTSPQEVDGMIICSSVSFGGDPLYGQGKICKCTSKNESKYLGNVYGGSGARYFDSVEIDIFVVEMKHETIIEK